jgi:tRNA(adenine34) deaminase
MTGRSKRGKGVSPTVGRASLRKPQGKLAPAVSGTSSDPSLANLGWGNLGSGNPRSGSLASDKLASVGQSADELWMEEALRSAQRALEAGEVPVGAVVVLKDRIVGRGWNRNVSDHDPSAHAEIVAMRDAAKNLGNHRLGDCELFATIEPCAMCAGAVIHARIRRLVYGADDPKAGAVHSVLAVINHSSLNHQMEVRGGVLAGKSAGILQEFFRKRR